MRLLETSKTRRMVRRATIKGRVAIVVRWAWVITISAAVIYLLLAKGGIL